MGYPLKGITVVAVEQAAAAPYVSSRLADAGARVIKIERPQGDFARGYDNAVQGDSTYFVWLNRGKESIVLDYSQPEDAELLQRIIANADVLIQNLGPGAAERAGFGWQKMRELHPRLITCDITGYGEEGPYASMKAYDLLVQAESGLCSVTGTPDAPGRIGVSSCDIGTGMYAHAAILEALLQRGITGQGSAIHVSLFDSMADWMTVPLLHYDYGGTVWPRVGLGHPTIAPYGAYSVGGFTEESAALLIGIQNDGEWARFVRQVLEQPDLLERSEFQTNMLRVQNERMDVNYFPSTREYAQQYGVDKALLNSLNKEIVIMHPGPINRGVEITSDVADSQQSVILDQVENGVAVRMAVIYLLASKIKQ